MIKTTPQLAEMTKVVIKRHKALLILLIILVILVMIYYVLSSPLNYLFSKVNYVFSANPYIYSFFIALIALILGQFFLNYYNAPKVELEYENSKFEMNSVNEVTYHKISFKNLGRTAAKNCIIYYKISQDRDAEEFVPKWDSIPEPENASSALIYDNSGNKLQHKVVFVHPNSPYLYNISQKVDLPPSGTHRENVPILFWPSQRMISQNFEEVQDWWKIHTPYIYSTMCFFTSVGKSRYEVKNNTSGEIHIAANNYYGIYKMVISHNGSPATVKITISHPKKITGFKRPRVRQI